MKNRLGIDIFEHSSSKNIKQINNIIGHFFNLKEPMYFKMNSDDYRDVVVAAQKKLNSINIIKKTIKNISNELFYALDTDKILVQSLAYLRATRPSNVKSGEFIQFHRESFFGKGMEKCFNVWTPIKGVSEKNSLNIIPLSHRIPLSKIKLKRKDSKFTKRYSAGHKIGLLYKDMIITSGVDLKKKMPLIVKNNHSAVFECNLIHGSAENKTNKIRFSYDFRIIRKKDYNKNMFKKQNFASGKDYFIEL